MEWDFLFFCNSVLLGVGLAMDAFSVSLANGLREPQMSAPRMMGIAGVFGGFQALMPLIGWACVHTAAQFLTAFSACIPWICLVLLCAIGGNMLREGLHGENKADAPVKTSAGALLLQGVATSIDALSVGFAIAGYGWAMALVCAGIIAAVTFVLCLLALRLGRRFGVKLAGRASLLGGVILIAIGLEIFLTGILG